MRRVSFFILKLFIACGRSSHRKFSLRKLFCNLVRPATLLKKRLWNSYFPVNFAKLLRIPFFIGNLCTTASGVSLNKYMQKIFYRKTLLNFEKFQACTLQLCYTIALHHSWYFRDFPKIFSGRLLVRSLSELIDNNCT